MFDIELQTTTMHFAHFCWNFSSHLVNAPMFNFFFLIDTLFLTLNDKYTTTINVFSAFFPDDNGLNLSNSQQQQILSITTTTKSNDFLGEKWMFIRSLNIFGFPTRMILFHFSPSNVPFCLINRFISPIYCYIDLTFCLSCCKMFKISLFRPGIIHEFHFHAKYRRWLVWFHIRNKNSCTLETQIYAHSIPPIYCLRVRSRNLIPLF